MKFRLFLCCVALAFPAVVGAQESAKNIGFKSINPQSIQAQLEFLASDWTEGRETGTRGEYMASDYIASMFKSMGLKPGGDQRMIIRSRNTGAGPASTAQPRSYFQNINFIETTPGAVQECWLIVREGNSSKEYQLQYLTDFSVNPGSYSIEIEAPVVFVGYGIVDKKLGIDDYKKTDISGKIVLRMAGFPGWRDPASPAYGRFAGEGNPPQYDAAKDLIASEKGALAVIEIRNGSTGFAPTVTNVPFRYNTETYEGDVPFNTQPRRRLSLPGTGVVSIPRISLSERALNSMLSQLGLDPVSFETEAASGKPMGMETSGKILLRVNSTVDSRIVQGRNVIGILEGEDNDNCIVLGAHYDHMGKVNGFVYNGADDNASGTVGIMTIANAFATAGIKPKNTIIFCAWTAEEKGLLGSKYFVTKAEKQKIRCYMNYDMISRTAPDDTTGRKCDFNYSSGLPVFRQLTEEHIKNYGLNLDMAYQTSVQPRGGSDFTSFSEKGIPIFLIHGKFTPDYHQFTDHAVKAVLPYMTDIIRLGYLNIFELANSKW